MIENSEVLVIFFGLTGTEAYENFLQASINPENITFAHCNDEVLAEKLGVEFNTIVLFRKFDEEKSIMAIEAISVEAIKAFVRENKNPVFFPFNESSLQKIYNEGLDTVFFLKNENESSQNAEEILKEISGELKGKLVVSVLDVSDKDGKLLWEQFEVDKELFPLPMFLLIRPSRINSKYLFKGEISIENLRIFVKDFSENRLEPWLKSEPIPDEKYEGDVRIVVGKNFNEVVIESENDVFVNYYASWNGHCRVFESKFSEFAKKLRNVEGLVIAKMDWTKNEIEGLEVRHYPELRFYPKGQKDKPVEYDRMLTVEDMIEYLKEHSESVRKYYDESVTFIDL